MPYLAPLLLPLTPGLRNTGVGFQALINNISGRFNTAIGDVAGMNLQTGNWNIYLGASVYGPPEESNTIRIGFAYFSPGEGVPPHGQNQTYIAGIIENSFPEGSNPAVVGVIYPGLLGTIPVDSLPAGPQGPPGLPGEGLVSGSLLFLVQGATPPGGYTLLGTCDFALVVAGTKKPTKLTVNVYQKQ